MLTVSQSEVLREELKLLATSIALAEESWKTADRAGKTALRKQINQEAAHRAEILELLRNAPVPPWDPAECWAAVIQLFNYNAQLDAKKAAFLAKLNKDGVGYAFEWFGPSIVKLEELARLTVWVIKLEELEDVQARLDRFFEILPEFTKDLLGKIVSDASARTSRSTSQFSNLMSDAILEARASLYDKMELQRYSITRIANHYASWKTLRDELSAE